MTGKAGDEGRTAEVAEADYSMLKPKPETVSRILDIAREQTLALDDQVLSLLVETYRLYEQLHELLVPLEQEFGTKTPLDTLKALIAAGGQRPAEDAFDEYLQKHWGASLSELTTLFDQVRAQGDEKPISYLRKQLVRHLHYQQGPVKRQERYDSRDFTKLTLTQLKTFHIPEATTERYRRAVAAIMQYNQAATHELDRWFIRAKEIKALVGGRGELIAEYLEQNQTEITAHHQAFGLTAKYNNKPYPITHVIHLEDPSILSERDDRPSDDE